LVHPHDPSSWTFLTNHAHVLLCLARDPDMRMREIALRVGITERAVQKIVADLEGEGYLARERHGRNNAYSFHPDLPLRHPIERHRTIADLMGLVYGDEPTGTDRPAERRHA
jgi:Mn-dependent DtxR family transcriptional regulator